MSSPLDPVAALLLSPATDPCPMCLRPRATDADEAMWQRYRRAAEAAFFRGERAPSPPLPAGWSDVDASHLCWRALYSTARCDPPDWWRSVSPLLVLRMAAALGIEPEGMEGFSHDD